MQSFDIRDIPSQPWVNGAGTRQELAISTQTGTPWRLSTAQIDRDCPFSTYPGLARLHVIIAGMGTHLSGAGVDLDAAPLVPVAFDGEIPLECRLKDGPCTALNVIFDPARIRADLTVLTAGAHEMAARDLAVFCVSGTASVQGETLLPGQGAVVAGETVIVVGADAQALCAQLDPV
ncbi:HutD family protein [Rhodobacteraceae bacterium KMM 6894]|nr:HutD family protein [Rhodobacteraceae bacterium KMM 6894]